MKKILSISIPIFIIIVIAGILASCGLKNSANDQTESSSYKAEESVKVIKAQVDMKDLEQAFSPTTKDDCVMFCTLNPDGIEEFTYLVLINAKDGTVKSKTKITDLEFIDGCKFGDDDTIIIMDCENNKAAKYDMNMKLIEIIDYAFDDMSGTASKSPFYNTMTSVEVDRSTYVSDIGSRFTYFYDDLNTIYIQPDGYKNDVAYYQKIALNEKATNSNRTIEYYVDDYENSRNLSKQQIECESSFAISDYAACVGNKNAFVIVFENDEKNNKYLYEGYLWDYTKDKQKNNNIEKYTIDSIEDYNNNIISDLKEKYDLNVHINDPSEAVKTRVNCENEYDILKLTDLLVSLQDFAKKLPDGMIKEIYSEYDYLKISFKDIRIDVVSEITSDDIGAFAESTGEEMEICFDINCFVYKHLPHEFMHLMDTRIEDYLREDNLLDYWQNKIGEDYKNPDTEDAEKFITEYAATNHIEDRAEMFAFMFTTATNPEKPSELKNGVINKKATLICQLLEKSFPSVKNSKSVLWEKYITVTEQ